MKGFRQRVVSCQFHLPSLVAPLSLPSAPADVSRCQSDKLRAHDSKSSSKKKDQTGTASPSHGGSGTHSPAGSAHATPTSSTTQLPIDPRSKPLPGAGDNAGSASNAAPPQPGQPGAPNSLAPGSQYMAGQQAAQGSTNNGMSGGGPGTPTRAGQPLAPSVVISPSAPVSTPCLKHPALLD